MSRLAQAGDSSTVSPGCASCAAMSTAASRLCGIVMRRSAVEHRAERVRRASDQHRRAHLAGEGLAQWREILALAIAAGDQTSGPGMPATAASVAPTLVPLESSM